MKALLQPPVRDFYDTDMRLQSVAPEQATGTVNDFLPFERRTLRKHRPHVSTQAVKSASNGT